MLKKIESSGKTLDDALSQASRELGVPVEEIGYEITQQIGKGLIGFLVGKETHINAWLKKDEPKVAPKPVAKVEPKPAVKAEPKAKSEPKPKSEKPAKVDVKKPAAAPSKPVKVEKPAAAAKTEKPAKPAASPKQTPKPRRDERRVNAPVTDEAINDAREFLGELLNKMGIEHTLEVKNVNNTINIDVAGEKMGLLIGKRGDTLDAVQYLTSLYINKGKSGYTKLNIDTENYREKREETLIRLAKNLERQVVQTRKPKTLEPMSPYERRIIHAALQGSTKIKTYSVGHEPNRKIVITLA